IARRVIGMDLGERRRHGATLKPPLVQGEACCSFDDGKQIRFHHDGFAVSSFDVVPRLLIRRDRGLVLPLALIWPVLDAQSRSPTLPSADGCHPRLWAQISSKSAGPRLACLAWHARSGRAASASDSFKSPSASIRPSSATSFPSRSS